MSKATILAKITARTDGGDNPVETEREISTDLLNEIFSAGVIDDYSTEIYTTNTGALFQYLLQLKKSGNEVTAKISVRHTAAFTVGATPIVASKILDWKTSEYKPSVFNNVTFPVFIGSSTVYLFINDIGLWLYSSLPPTSTGVFYESSFIRYLTPDL